MSDAPTPSREAAMPAPAARRVSRAASLEFLSRAGELWTLAILIVLIAIFGILSPDFFSRASWLATSQFAVEYLLLGLGETFVIVTGGIDLSVGAILGFSGMVGAMVMRAMIYRHVATDLDLIAGIASALTAGTFVGWLNGQAITRLRLTPFVVTLGMLSMCTGGIYLLNNGGNVGTIPDIVGTLGSFAIGGWLPVTVLVTAVFAVLSALLLAETRFGLRTYAIGSNPQGAARAGIDVRKHLVKIYMLSGFLAAVAGLMVMARFASASVQAGANDELDAITAVVIGGTSLFGGRGTVLGTVIGSFVITVMVTGLILIGVQPFWQQVAVGAILIFAVAMDQLRDRLLDAF
ncbi:ABC transporter permease [Acidiphilium iwatense]|uniref:ABC transporter permease n=1 Tax=Acidiphilium iwatense TaxID=768198 RepID=A0ABS9DUB2_9PROT|nr:ABC transporter permease [Acidiphilium iwatense]MCF3946282.1 ABC transporter permease [Acidiphilium iwatense]